LAGAAEAVIDWFARLAPNDPRIADHRAKAALPAD